MNHSILAMGSTIVILTKATSEFDEMGNENNVIIYDFTKEKSESKAFDKKVGDDLTTINQGEPNTPDPTPLGDSPTPEATPSAAIITPTVTKSFSDDTKRGREQNTTASKGVPKTTEPIKPVVTEAPETQTRASQDTIPALQTSIPDPQPVSRPSVPEPTGKVVTDQDASSSTGTASQTQPTTSINGSEASTGAVTDREAPDSAGTAVSRTQDVEDPIPKDWNFFTRLLELIAQFFKHWFHRGATA